MAYRTITILGFFFFFAGCGMEKQTCDDAKTVFSSLKFAMILREWKLDGNRIYLYGYDINSPSKEIDYYNDQTRDFQFIIDKFHQGDTIVKKKGDDFIKIYHGKDHFKFTYVCEKEYGEEITKFKQERF